MISAEVMMTKASSGPPEVRMVEVRMAVRAFGETFKAFGEAVHSLLTDGKIQRLVYDKLSSQGIDDAVDVIETFTRTDAVSQEALFENARRDLAEYARVRLVVSAAVAQRRAIARDFVQTFSGVLKAEIPELDEKQRALIESLAIGQVMTKQVGTQSAPADHLLEVLERPGDGFPSKPVHGVLEVSSSPRPVIVADVSEPMLLLNLKQAEQVLGTDLTNTIRSSFASYRFPQGLWVLPHPDKSTRVDGEDFAQRKLR